MRPPRGLFRDTELPRFLVLVAILVAGWPLAFYYYTQKSEPEPPPAPIADLPPLPPPDDSLELQGVEDKKKLSLRDNPAYAELLKRSRQTPAGELAAESRREISFAELVGRPARYRGLPIHIEGTAYQILRVTDVPESLTPQKHLYEAWVVPRDQIRSKKKFPYCLVFEHPPEGLPGGTNLHEFVGFDGYFLKLLAYEAADGQRFAPMLVGRLGWTPGAVADAPAEPLGGIRWWMVVLVGLMVVSLARFAWALRRNFAAPRPPVKIRTAFEDELPEGGVDDWLGQVADDDQGRGVPAPRD